jgi:transcription initiation factor TFIIB
MVIKLGRRKIQETFTVMDFENKIKEVCNKLQLENEVQNKALGITDLIRTRYIGHSDPESLAAGAIYIAAILNGTRRTQTEISMVMGMGILRINHGYKFLAENLDLDILL